MNLEWFGDIEEKFGKREIITGPMASAKSSIVLMLASIFKEFSEDLNCEIDIFRPTIDKRQNMSRLNIEKEQNFIRVKKTKEITDYLKENTNPAKRKVIAIDEIEFLDSEIITVVQDLTKQGNYVLMSGLLLSFRGEYFPFSDYSATMEDLMRVVPEENRHVSKLAKCRICRGTAEYTQRLLNGLPAPYYDSLIKVDDEKSKAQADVKYDYQPRCKEHFFVPGKEEYGFVSFVLSKNNGVEMLNIKDLCQTTGKIQPEITEQVIATLLAEKQAITLNDGKIYYTPKISVMRNKELKI